MYLSLYSIWIVIYLFTAMFCPPILPFNSIYVLTLIAIIWLSTRKRRGSRLKIVLPKPVFAFLAYILFIMAINSLFDDSSLLIIRLQTVYQLFVLLPMQFICSRYVIESAKRKGYNKDGIIKLIIYGGLIEVLFVVVAFISPSLRKAFLSSIVRRGGIERVYANEYVLGYRAYGWADTLLDTFGYGMGILAGICLIYKSLGKIRYLGIVSFVFATILNSRTGIAVFFIALIVWIVYLFRGGNLSGMRRFFFLILIAFIIIFTIIELDILDSTTISWISAGYESIWNTLIGKEMTYRTGSLQNSMLTSKMWHFPDNLFSLLFGKGHGLFGAGKILGFASDVGYVNYIWICGILGTVFLLLYIFSWFRKTILETQSADLRIIRVFLCISFYVVFIKGNVLTHTVGTFITIIIMLLDEKKERLNRRGMEY